MELFREPKQTHKHIEIHKWQNCHCALVENGQRVLTTIVTQVEKTDFVFMPHKSAQAITWKYWNVKNNFLKLLEKKQVTSLSWVEKES